MTDEYGIDLFCGNSTQQPRYGRIAEVEKKPESVMLDEESTARLARRRPCTAGTENGESHSRNAINPRSTSRKSPTPSFAAYGWPGCVAPTSRLGTRHKVIDMRLPPLPEALTPLSPARIAAGAVGDRPVDVPTSPITITPYDPTWPEMYTAERTRILAALGSRALAIEHVGRPRYRDWRPRTGSASI